MIPHQRRQEILDFLREEGSARVIQLSKLFQVTEVTIRKDLEKLQREGLTIKEHGGAFLKIPPQGMLNLHMQPTGNAEKRAAIGAKAAEFISDGDTVIIDSGTTTTELAKNLDDKRRLTVITTSLSVALHLGSNHGINTHMTGGQFKPVTLDLTGPHAAEYFDGVHVDKLFLSVIGLSLETGLTYTGFPEVEVKRAMIKAAEKVYLLADSTKIEKRSFASLGNLNLVNVIITDSEIESDFQRQIENLGIEVVVAISRK